MYHCCTGVKIFAAVSQTYCCEVENTEKVLAVSSMYKGIKPACLGFLESE
jgi:hypothetical protein